MNIMQMKKSDFKKLKKRSWGEDIGEFNALVLIPTRRKHDSGFMCMEFAAIGLEGKPICRLGGGSDVVHIGGIITMAEKAIGGWSIDLLPCGYFRLFNIVKHNLKAGRDVSDFEVEAV